MEMTRKQFMMLFKLEEDEEGMLIADEEFENGKSWFEIAQDTIAQMNSMLCNL